MTHIHKQVLIYAVDNFFKKPNLGKSALHLNDHVTHPFSFHLNSITHLGLMEAREVINNAKSCQVKDVIFLERRELRDWPDGQEDRRNK